MMQMAAGSANTDKTRSPVFTQKMSNMGLGIQVPGQHEPSNFQKFMRQSPYAANSNMRASVHSGAASQNSTNFQLVNSAAM